MWSNSGLMWWMMMPITNTHDEQVEQDAELDDRADRLDQHLSPKMNTPFSSTR